MIIYLFRIYKKHLDAKIWWLMLFSIAVAAFDGLGISMLIPMLETLDLNQQTEKIGLLYDVIRYFGVYGSLTGILFFILTVYLLKALTSFTMGYYQSKIHGFLSADLRNKMYDAIVNVDYSYFVKRNAGYFITVMQIHVLVVLNSFNGYLSLVTSVIMSFTYLFVAASISWRVALLSLLMGALIIGLFSFVVKYVKRLSQKIALLDKINSQVAIQALYAFKYLVSTYSYPVIQIKYSESVFAISKLGVKSAIANSFTRSLQELATIMLLVILIIIEVVYLGRPIASVFVILLLFYRVINHMLGIQQEYQRLVNSIGKIESVDSEFQQLNANKFKNGKKEIIKPINLVTLELKDVYVRYSPSSQWVLKGINLLIKPNQTIAFVGSSGAGKSTLVDIITGLIQPNKGSILIDNVSLNEIDSRSWRSKIGFVNQDVMVFDDTIWNNVSMFDKNANKLKIEEACRAANIWEFVEASEHGLHTRIGDRGMHLSGGQKQRLSIARELYKKPGLLILDEATSALDGESEDLIKESIEALKGKVTVILIAHRFSTIRQADKIFVISDGIVMESGTLEYLKAQNGVFSKMLEHQIL
jgi:ABC-type multidrug transport system fused ATPase/permease subunit